MVPFTSAGLAMNSTIGGHTPIAFTALPPAMTNIQAGKLRGLAVMASKRNAGLPDVPTMGEAGIPDQESDTLTGIVAHAGTPKELIDRWHKEIARIVALPDIQRTSAQDGLRSDRQHAGGIRRADQERSHQVGQGRQGRQYQDELMLGSSGRGS